MSSSKQTLKILVCASTKEELKAYGELGEKEWQQINHHYISKGVGLFITGVGIPQSWEGLLYCHDHFQFSLILNIGIAGAYPGFRGRIGDVVIGSSEVYGDVGVEIPLEKESSVSKFESLANFPFGQFYKSGFPLSFQTDWTDFNLPFKILLGQGCTVNMCAGTQLRGQSRRMATQSDFESMEGAVFAQYGAQKKIPVVEIRAISNIAGHRDMKPENIKLALNNLTQFLSKFKESYEPGNLHKHFPLSQ